MVFFLILFLIFIFGFLGACIIALTDMMFIVNLLMAMMFSVAGAILAVILIIHFLLKP